MTFPQAPDLTNLVVYRRIAAAAETLVGKSQDGVINKEEGLTALAMALGLMAASMGLPAEVPTELTKGFWAAVATVTGLVPRDAGPQ